MSRKLYINITILVAVTVSALAAAISVGATVIFSNEADSATCLDNAETVTLAEVADGGLTAICTEAEIAALITERGERVIFDLMSADALTEEQLGTVREWAADMPADVVARLAINFVNSEIEPFNDLLTQYGTLTVAEALEQWENDDSDFSRDVWQALLGELDASDFGFDGFGRGRLGGEFGLGALTLTGGVDGADGGSFDFRDFSFSRGGATGDEIAICEGVAVPNDPSIGGEALWLAIERALQRCNDDDTGGDSATTTDSLFAGEFDDLLSGFSGVRVYTETGTLPWFSLRKPETGTLSLFRGSRAETAEQLDELLEGLLDEDDLAEVNELIDELLGSGAFRFGEGGPFDAESLDGLLDYFDANDFEGLLEDFDWGEIERELGGFFRGGLNLIIGEMLDYIADEDLLTVDELTELTQWLDARPTLITDGINLRQFFRQNS